MLYSICQQIWKTQQWPQDWKRSILIPVLKKVRTQECANHRTVALILHATKVMLKIVHARRQYYANQEFPDVQAGFRKGKGTRDQFTNIRWIIEKAREFQKNTYLCFINYAKAFVFVDHDKLWKALTEMGIPDHLTCLLRNLYAGQEATIRTLLEQLICSKLRKSWAVCCSPVVLTYRLSTAWEMLSWMRYKFKSR